VRPRAPATKRPPAGGAALLAWLRLLLPLRLLLYMLMVPDQQAAGLQPTHHGRHIQAQLPSTFHPQPADQQRRQQPLCLARHGHLPADQVLCRRQQLLGSCRPARPVQTRWQVRGVGRRRRLLHGGRRGAAAQRQRERPAQQEAAGKLCA
jgi:hypothetical protein